MVSGGRGRGQRRGSVRVFFSCFCRSCRARAGCAASWGRIGAASSPKTSILPSNFTAATRTDGSALSRRSRTGRSPEFGRRIRLVCAETSDGSTAEVASPGEKRETRIRSFFALNEVKIGLQSAEVSTPELCSCFGGVCGSRGVVWRPEPRIF